MTFTGNVTSTGNMTFTGNVTSAGGKTGTGTCTPFFLVRVDEINCYPSFWYITNCRFDAKPPG